MNELKPLFKIVPTEAYVIFPEVSKPKYTGVSLISNVAKSTEKASLLGQQVQLLLHTEQWSLLQVHGEPPTFSPGR